MPSTNQPNSENKNTPFKMKKWLREGLTVTAVIALITLGLNLYNTNRDKSNLPIVLNESQLLQRIDSGGVFNQKEIFTFIVPDGAICVWEFNGETRIARQGEKISTDKAKFFADEECTIPWPTHTPMPTPTSTVTFSLTTSSVFKENSGNNSISINEIGDFSISLPEEWECNYNPQSDKYEITNKILGPNVYMTFSVIQKQTISEVARARRDFHVSSSGISYVDAISVEIIGDKEVYTYSFAYENALTVSTDYFFEFSGYTFHFSSVCLTKSYLQYEDFFYSVIKSFSLLSSYSFNGDVKGVDELNGFIVKTYDVTSASWFQFAPNGNLEYYDSLPDENLHDVILALDTDRYIGDAINVSLPGCNTGSSLGLITSRDVKFRISSGTFMFDIATMIDENEYKVIAHFEVEINASGTYYCDP